MRRKNPSLRKKPTLSQIRIALLSSLVTGQRIGLRQPVLNGCRSIWLRSEEGEVRVHSYGRGQGWSDQSSETTFPPGWEGIERVARSLLEDWEDLFDVGEDFGLPANDPRDLPPPEQIKAALKLLPPPPPRLRSLKPYLSDDDPSVWEGSKRKEA